MLNKLFFIIFNFKLKILKLICNLQIYHQMSKYNYKYLQELLQKYECKFFENENYEEITLKREVKWQIFY